MENNKHRDEMREKFERTLKEVFERYWSNVENINELPSFEELIESINEMLIEEMNDEYFEVGRMELDSLSGKLKDGTTISIELWTDCILHRNRGEDGKELFQVDHSDFYICGSCFERLENRHDLVAEIEKEYPTGRFISSTPPTPKSWTDQGTIKWLIDHYFEKTTKDF